MAKLDTAEQRALAIGVAKELGEGWSTRTPKAWGNDATAPFVLAGLKGEEIWLNTEWNDSDRVHISGQYPRGPKGEVLRYSSDGDPRITVSLKRGHAAIANGIKSRFLPDYTVVLEKVQARIVNAVQALNCKSAIAERISASLCGLAKQSTDTNREPIEGAVQIVYGTKDVYGSLVASYDGKVKLDIEVSADLAVKIAAVIAAHVQDAIADEVIDEILEQQRKAGKV